MTALHRLTRRVFYWFVRPRYGYCFACGEPLPNDPWWASPTIACVVCGRGNREW